MQVSPTWLTIASIKGKQFKLTEGLEVAVPYLGPQAKPGKSLTISKLLYVEEEGILQNPKERKVSGEILAVKKAPKILIVKTRRRKNCSRTRRGHRQTYTLIKINKLT